MTVSRLLDRVFPAIPSTKNQPTPYITTKTIAYIFALIIALRLSPFQRTSNRGNHPEGT
jgi:hypothetical protein